MIFKGQCVHSFSNPTISLAFVIITRISSICINVKKFWLGLAAVIVFSFAVLLYYGREIYIKAPSIPEIVATHNGKVLFTKKAMV